VHLFSARTKSSFIRTVNSILLETSRGELSQLNLKLWFVNDDHNKVNNLFLIIWYWHKSSSG